LKRIRNSKNSIRATLFRGIGWRIFVSFTTLLCVLILILAVVTWKYLENVTYTNAANELRVQSITLVQQLQRDLTRIETSQRFLVSDGGRLNDLMSWRHPTTPKKIENYLQSRTSPGSLFEDFYVFSDTGDILARTDHEWPSGNVSDTQFFKLGLKKVGFADIFEDPLYAGIVLLVVGPIGDSKAPEGVLVGKVRLSRLYELMEHKLGLANNAEAFLLDSQLHFVTPAKNVPADEVLKSHLAETPLKDHLNEEFWVGRYRNYKGEEVLGTVRKTQGYDGFLVVEKPYTDIQHHVEFITQVLIISVIVLLLALTLTTILITRSITRPVLDLVESAHRIASGDLETAVDVPVADDEIGFLALELDSMRVRINQYQSQLRERLEISERKRLESERLAAIGTLAASLAHEIRNPLNGMSLLVTQMERSPERSDKDRKILSGLRSEIARLDRLVSDILDYARPLQLEVRRLDLRELTQEVMEFVSPLMQKNKIEVDLRLGMSPLEIQGDRDRLRQALLNVTQNAIEAMTDGGHLTVGLARVDEKVLLTIQDTGPGIPAEIQSRIFDLFFSTKEKGTGLGLSTVRKIFDAHGGSIEILSGIMTPQGPSVGTLFQFYLPAV
jgi:signal transduction histidine kinase